MTAMETYLATRDDAFAKMTAALDAANETYAAAIQPLQGASSTAVATIRAHYERRVEHLQTECNALTAAETRKLMSATYSATQEFEETRRQAQAAYDDAVSQAWEAVLAENGRWQA